MDSPTDLFEDSSPRMHSFAPPSSMDLDALHCQQNPGYSLIHHLLQPSAKHTDGHHGGNISQRLQDKNIEDKNKTAEEIEGGADGRLDDDILGAKKRHGNATEWDQELLRVKRMKLESRGRDGDVEKSGRRKRKEKEELKEQLEEARERLQALQEKVWRAFGEKRWADDERKRKNDFPEDEDIFDEEDFDGGDSTFEKFPKRPKEGAGEAMWCASLLRGDWDGGEEAKGGQKFAQALKVELGSAVARVIDRVLRLYTENTESEPSTPTAMVSFLDGAKEQAEKMVKMVEDRDTGKEIMTGHPNEAPASMGVQRSIDNRRGIQGTALPSTRHLPMHHPSPLPLPQPQLLPQPKDPSSSSFIPSSSSSFTPHLPPLPLLHYSMQQLFSRTLPHLQPPPHPARKDYHHMNAEAFGELAHPPPFPPHLPPLLGHLEPSLSRPGRERGRGVEMSMRGGGGMDAVDFYLNAAGNQEGLSPCHLKKAKLMFFYARYPSSTTLKTYFPDVKFNRCVTSQMIKWFSNFREFFYIQMERFARQAVREALTRDGGAHMCRDSQLRVGRDTELYRILNMHYNKSNVYQVPERFIEVSEVALREFYAAIWTGRDSDPCWKKGIYKIICKLDSPVPDAFRLPGCPLG